MEFIRSTLTPGGGEPRKALGEGLHPARARGAPLPRRRVRVQPAPTAAAQVPRTQRARGAQDGALVRGVSQRPTARANGERRASMSPARRAGSGKIQRNKMLRTYFLFSKIRKIKRPWRLTVLLTKLLWNYWIVRERGSKPNSHSMMLAELSSIMIRLLQRSTVQ